MISLGTVFWLMVFFFSLIGVLRGWTKEVVATSGLVLSLFAINQFGFGIINFLSDAPPSDIYATALRRQQFYWLGSLHIAIAFFSYQGPAIAGRNVVERLRVRDSFQDKLLGGIVGALNGYLIVGAMWSLLEYVRGATEWVRLPAGTLYPFEGEFLIRPPDVLQLEGLISSLPLPLLSAYLPFLVVIVFLFVLVVMI